MTGGEASSRSNTDNKKGRHVKKTGDNVFDGKRSEYDRQSKRINMEITELHSQVNAITAEIRSLSMNDENRVLRDQLIGKIGQLKAEKEKLHLAKTPLYTSLKECQELIKKNQEDLSQAKDRLPCKTIEEADRKIGELESMLEAGRIKVSDEGRTVAEISKLKKNKRALEELKTQYAIIDDLKMQADQHRKMIQEKSKQGASCSEKIAELGEEIDKLSASRSINQDRIRMLVEERNGLRQQIEEKNKAKQGLHAKFKEAQKEHELWLEKENARREKQAKRRAIENSIKELNGKLKELDSPPCKSRIAQCETMEKYLRNHVLQETRNPEAGKGRDTPAVARLDPTLVIKSKYDREDQENYYGATVPKSQKKTKSNAAARTSGPVQLPVWLLAGLEELGIKTPLKFGDVASTVSMLVKTKGVFEREQDEILKTLDSQRSAINVQIMAETQKLSGFVI